LTSKLLPSAIQHHAKLALLYLLYPISQRAFQSSTKSFGYGMCIWAGMPQFLIRSHHLW
jgi:hypothetical protein